MILILPIPPLLHKNLPIRATAHKLAPVWREPDPFDETFVFVGVTLIELERWTLVERDGKILPTRDDAVGPGFSVVQRIYLLGMALHLADRRPGFHEEGPDLVRASATGLGGWYNQKTCCVGSQDDITNEADLRRRLNQLVRRSSPHRSLTTSSRGPPSWPGLWEKRSPGRDGDLGLWDCPSCPRNPARP